jgi:hypothetical protein
MVLRAAQRIDSRVRRVDEALDGPPEKPKRMHWARYEQLSAQYAGDRLGVIAARNVGLGPAFATFRA